ncbi:MAG: hypothetical protein HC929_11805 [Leptolyngbyaceae cyanobacterium SM2_5_2]|nr:hypothetical protein [Leptolyngbyaceae cyanobacterium SM2_5_2]
MTLKALSGLAASAVATALVATATAPAMACMHNKAVGPEITTSFDGPAGFSGNIPDLNALSKAGLGFGAIAALLAGGTMLYRKQHLAKVAEAEAAAIWAETDLEFTTHTESVLVSDEPAKASESPKRDAQSEAIHTSR